MQFVESKHTPRNTLLRAVRTGAPVKGGGVAQGVRRPGRRRGAIRPRLAELLESGRRACVSGYLARADGGAVRGRGAAAGRRRRGRAGNEVFTLPGPGDRRVQRARGRRRPVRHHQRLRRHRPGLRRRPGHRRDRRRHRTGPTTPTDVEALAPGRARRGLGRRHRRQPRRARRRSRSPRVPVGRGDRDVDVPSYELVYPDGAARRRDAAAPTRRPAGSTSSARTSSAATLYAAPSGCRADRPNRLDARSGRCCRSPPTAAFFPDGRHLIVRNYAEAAVYALPDARARSAASACPTSSRARGSRSTADGTIYASSEGLHAPVLRIAAAGRAYAGRWSRRRQRRPRRPTTDARAPTPSARRPGRRGRCRRASRLGRAVGRGAAVLGRRASACGSVARRARSSRCGPALVRAAGRLRRPRRTSAGCGPTPSG